MGKYIHLEDNRIMHSGKTQTTSAKNSVSTVTSKYAFDKYFLTDGSPNASTGKEKSHAVLLQT
jgi:hypothetical protein